MLHQCYLVPVGLCLRWLGPRFCTFSAVRFLCGSVSYDEYLLQGHFLFQKSMYGVLAGCSGPHFSFHRFYRIVCSGSGDS